MFSPLKYYLYLFSVCVLWPTAYTCASIPSSYKIKTIVIDAGHGGHDPGAIGKHVYEKAITLSVALKLGNLIEKNLPDVKVIYTRKTDVFVELIKRAEIANKSNANLFISIHVNSNPNPTASGTDTWVMGQHKNNENFEVAKEENKVILVENDYSSKYEGFDPNSTESYIIFNLMQNVFIDQSLEIASEVEHQFSTKANRRTRGVKAAPFLVLWKTTMPSILIETGFISNPAEEKFLNSEEGQDKIASSIFEAFKSYKERVESKTNVSLKTEKNSPNNKNTSPKESIPGAETTEFDTTGIFFSLQILSSQNSIKNDSSLFNGLPYIREIVVNNTYKYMVGREIEYNKILLVKDKIKTKFPDAFIVSFKDGARIPLSKALEEIRLQRK